jgi:Cu+-exporting ATPase
VSTPSDLETRDVDLALIGMTCASCANRIERGLNKLDGVTATVNYATGTAHVAVVPGIIVDDIVRKVHDIGYEAIAPSAPGTPVSSYEDGGRTEVERAADAEVDDLRTRFWVSFALAVPVVLISMVPALQFPFWQWLCFALASPVVVWGAWPFHRVAWRSARHGAATMDTLISMGCLAAYIWSVWALFRGGAGLPTYSMTESIVPSLQRRTSSMPDVYLEVAAALPVFILAGRWFEARAKKSSGAALRALTTLGAKDVSVLRDGIETRVPIGALGVGDEFVVRPGERIASDGVVVTGSSAVDVSLITGESVPVDVQSGSDVIGATINVDGHLVVRATRVGEETSLAQIARLVTQAQSGKAPVQRLADRVSAVFVPVVLVISFSTLIVWLRVGG